MNRAQEDLKPCGRCGSTKFVAREHWYTDSIYTERVPCTCDRGMDVAFERRRVIRASCERQGSLEVGGDVSWDFVDVLDRDEIEDERRIECQPCLKGGGFDRVEQTDSAVQSEVVLSLECVECGQEVQVRAQLAPTQASEVDVLDGIPVSTPSVDAPVL